MAPDTADSCLEIGHVLFMDIVGYSKLLTDQQRAVFELLNETVRNTPQFRAAQAADRLVRIPTGDGMALVFFTSPDAPVRCAREISRKLRDQPELSLRMGINSGPVDHVSDVSDRSNVTGAGINMAQRVMDCGDAGHILLARRVADDLGQYQEWQSFLHPLGEVEVKHGMHLEVANLYGEDFGNPEVPNKIKYETQQRAAAQRRAVQIKRRRILLSLVSVLLLAAVIGVGTWIWQRRVALTSGYKFGTAAIPEKSIAVLPFENFGDEKENAYLADGVQDEILTDLTKVADLKVISRRSVAQYRDTKQTIRQIGQALQVAHVLEGSVRKIAGRIHVTAQLIDTRTETEAWAEKYDRDIADVFQIQNEISQAIVTQLKAALSPAEKAAIEEKPTQDKEAYDLYLRARSLVYQQTGTQLGSEAEENSRKAIPLLESAISRDPKFALAYCVLGDAQMILDEGPVDPKEVIDTALRISPNSAEAHLTLAKYFIHMNEDVSAGEKELLIAAAGLPGRVEVFNLRAEIEAQRGQWKQALRDREKATELDPWDSFTVEDLVTLNIMLRNYEDAERHIAHATAIMPQHSTDFVWRQKAMIAVARGDTKSAMAALEANPVRNLGVFGVNHQIADVFVLERNYAKAEEILQSVVETARARNMLRKPPGHVDWARGITLEKLARIARFQGEKEKARGYFESARQIFDQALHGEPNSWTDSHARAYIAEIDAALGRKEDAIREGRKAVELWPLKRNAVIAPDVAIIVAIAYMWSGERDAALEQLAEVVKLPAWSTPLPACPGFSAGELKLNPIWDELRNDSRFDKIIAEAAKPVKLD